PQTITGGRSLARTPDERLGAPGDDEDQREARDGDGRVDAQEIPRQLQRTRLEGRPERLAREVGGPTYQGEVRPVHSDEEERRGRDCDQEREALAARAGGDRESVVEGERGERGGGGVRVQTR